MLENVNIELWPGEVHGIVGENGAGKSTLSNIICGLTPPNSGNMQLNGASYKPKSKAQADSFGVRLVMQELNLIPTLSVAENLFLKQGLPRKWGMIDFNSLRKKAKDHLESIKLTGIDVSKKVGALGLGQQQMIDVASNLVGCCRLLILDESTAALTESETEHLFAQVRKLKEEGLF